MAAKLSIIFLCVAVLGLICLKKFSSFYETTMQENAPLSDAPSCIIYRQLSSTAVCYRLLLLRQSSLMSSSVLPLVSGTKRATKMAAITQITP